MKTIKQIVEQDVLDAKEDGYTSYISDLLEHGCQSGMVSDLIYHSDTCKFYENHKEEISEMVADLVVGHGVPIGELLTNWDNEDPLVLDTHNQNLLAWFSYEQTAQNLEYIMEEQKEIRRGYVS